MLHHRVGDDAAVIEGQFDGVGVEDFDFGSVGGGLHLAAKDAGQEGDADIVAARVAVRLGVNADEARDLYGEACLLRGLTYGGSCTVSPTSTKPPGSAHCPSKGSLPRRIKTTPASEGITTSTISFGVSGPAKVRTSWAVSWCIMFGRTARGNRLAGPIRWRP